MAAEELETCPFCGSMPTIEVDDYGEVAYVYCPRGGCAIGYERLSPREWNQRPDTVETGATSTNSATVAITAYIKEFETIENPERDSYRAWNQCARRKLWKWRAQFSKKGG